MGEREGWGLGVREGWGLGVRVGVEEGVGFNETTQNLSTDFFHILFPNLPYMLQRSLSNCYMNSKLTTMK